MKRTRRAFCLEGNKNDLTKVITEIRGFKAINYIEAKVTHDKLNKVFASNKSVICTDPDVEKYVETVFISINNKSAQNTIFTDNIGGVSIRRQFKQIADSCNIDIGDHKANSTKEGPSQDPMECVFCRYLSGHPDNYQPSMYESEHFVLMPNMGHFVPGSLLIIPRAHIMSCAELSLDVLNELLEVIDDAKFILKEVYGMDTLLWENGSGSGGHGKDKSSIVHAHIHMNPCDMDILKVSAEKGITLKEINYPDLQNYQENSYLLVQNYDLKWYIMSDPELYIPRQYVRQLVAEHVGIPGDLWNWRIYPFADEVVVTTNKIREYLISHKDSLPERIVRRTSHFA